MYYSKDYNDLDLTIEQDYLIDIADESGLIFTGEFDDDDQPLFLGNNKAWETFDKKLSF